VARTLSVSSKGSIVITAEFKESRLKDTFAKIQSPSG